jgi:hypothetical protein
MIYSQFKILAIMLAAILDLCKLRELPKVVVRTTKLNLL